MKVKLDQGGKGTAQFTKTGDPIEYHVAQMIGNSSMLVYGCTHSWMTLHHQSFFWILSRNANLSQSE